MFEELKIKGNKKPKGWWERILMGLYPYPYIVTKSLLVIDAEVRGYILYEKKVFRRNRVVLHLPGMKGYNPVRHLIYKVMNEEKIATDAFWYIDNGKLTAPTACECLKAACKVCCTLTFVGIQYKRRKRNGLFISQKQWDKVKNIISRIKEEHKE